MCGILFLFEFPEKNMTFKRKQKALSFLHMLENGTQFVFLLVAVAISGWNLRPWTTKLLDWAASLSPSDSLQCSSEFGLFVLLSGLRSEAMSRGGDNIHLVSFLWGIILLCYQSSETENILFYTCAFLFKSYLRWVGKTGPYHSTMTDTVHLGFGLQRMGTIDIYMTASLFVGTWYIDLFRSSFPSSCTLYGLTHSYRRLWRRPLNFTPARQQSRHRKTCSFRFFEQLLGLLSVFANQEKRACSSRLTEAEQPWGAVGWRSGEEGDLGQLLYAVSSSLALLGAFFFLLIFSIVGHGGAVHSKSWWLSYWGTGNVGVGLAGCGSPLTAIYTTAVDHFFGRRLLTLRMTNHPW